MAIQLARRCCIYCGHEVRKVKQGEHIVPKAVGGALTIKTVCEKCNNSFSEIDGELCSRSPLSVVASQMIDASVWQAWDVDHAAANLLLEARPIWPVQSIALYPQMIFERSGAQIRGDQEEMLQFGQEAFERVFVRSMLRAFHQHEAGKPRWLHFERLDANPWLARGYRFPPRIFARYSINELADRLLQDKRASLIVRYENEADKRFALNTLDAWNPSGRMRSMEVGLGSALPAIRCLFERSRTLRALLKIAVNLLSNYCVNTPVNRDGFGGVIRLIKGEAPVDTTLFQHNGFVYALDVESISSNDACHSFRLLHMDGFWHIYSSFFGGRIGSVVHLPGPNGEDWSCADIVAPLRSKNWTIKTGSVLQPLTVRVEWQRLEKIMPSVEMLNVHSRMRVQPV
jgi:hypothetical protein